jgi:predicted nucleotidyltransferase component of viral defense system
MINKKSRTIEWITDIAKQLKIHDIALAEKTIRAFSLLEALALSGCPFVFKGGSSLMLHLNTSKRLSIDIDIICPPGTIIEEFLNKYSKEYDFGKVELVERISRTNIPKQHAKFYYEVSYPGNGGQDKILLDVLFEESHYSKIVSLPIKSPLLTTEAPHTMVSVPSHEDLLGDKLTAFAPHTTGIPFYKGLKICTMEIIKQLFDIASLFDITNNLNITRKTFIKFAKVELEYRNRDSTNYLQVLDDIYESALCICMRGLYNNDEYKLFQDGIRKIGNFIHSEKYTIDSAIINASKVTYLSKLLTYGVNNIEHYSVDNFMELMHISIKEPLPTKLNKLKKTHPEAFFYWCKTEELLQNKE